MTGGTAGPPGDLIEDYLDRLLVSLSGSPRQVRHTLAEVEAHLRDAVAEGIAAGLPEETAQVQALERIGPVHAVTGRPALSPARRRRCCGGSPSSPPWSAGPGSSPSAGPGWWGGCCRR